ncbi:MAG: DoxX family protein [Myxococcaceae bacterium]
MHDMALWVAQTLAAGFLAVLFLQSGLDKVLDWKGNKEYIGGFFSKTPLRRFSTLMLFQITVLEVFAGVISAAGCVAVALTRDSTFAFFGAALAGVNVLALFFGQRIAKDYAAAAGMVPYAIFSIGAVLLEGASR